jgi:hypothetical protein
VWRWDGFAWIATGVSSLTGAVRYDIAQSLTSAQAAQARSNILADTIANPSANLLINGDMAISQENGTTAVTPVNNTSKFVADQWHFLAEHAAGSAAWSAGVGSGGPYPGITGQLNISSTAAFSPVAATDDVTLSQKIEGQRWAKLGWGSASALPISIGFWIWSSVVGTCALNIRNAANNRSYVTPISVASASTWQYKTVTIPGDITGTWPTDTSVGAVVSFCFGSGNNYITPNVNVWQAGLLLAQTGITNFFATSNTVVISGVSLIPGNTPVPLEQSAAIRRDPAEELRLCMRYYEKYSQITVRSAVVGASYYWLVARSRKRVSNPNISLANIAYGNASAAAVQNANYDGIEVTFTASAVAGYVVADAIINARM